MQRTLLDNLLSIVSGFPFLSALHEYHVNEEGYLVSLSLNVCSHRMQLRYVCAACVLACFQSKSGID